MGPVSSSFALSIPSCTLLALTYYRNARITMQKSLKAIESVFINTSFNELVAARDRADSANIDGTTLGEGERIRILAATGAATIDELILGAKVVKRLKRAALIQVHNLLYYCNRYGVMTCTVPASFVIGQFNGQWGPSICFAGGPEILRRLGVTSAYCAGGDSLYDYSGCIEAPVDWLSVAK